MISASSLESMIPAGCDFFPVFNLFFFVTEIHALLDFKKRMSRLKHAPCISGTISVSPMLNTMKSTHTGLMFRLWWKEQTWRSLKLTLSPKFYFYKLFHDILPFQKNRTRDELIEQIEACLEAMDFTLEMKDEDKEGYSSLYEKDNIKVDMSKFYQVCDIKNRETVIFQGCVNVEITISETGTVETDLTFFSEDLNLNDDNYKDWSQYLNHVTLDYIQFLP